MIQFDEFKSYFGGVPANRDKLIATFYNIIVENNYDFEPSDEEKVVGYIKDKDGNTIIRLDKGNVQKEPEMPLPISTFEEAINNMEYKCSMQNYDLNQSHGKWYTRFDNNRKKKRK